MDDSIKIEGYYNLLALHKTLMEAKFHENPNNYEVCDSQLVAEICNQIAEKIIEVESNKNSNKLIKKIECELGSSLNKNLVGIETELGYIRGRDGIYMDYFRQENNKLYIGGEINGRLCSKDKKDIWYKYELIFDGVIKYECSNIDFYMWNIESSFDEIVDEVEFKRYSINKKLYRGFIISTYDYIYKIFATNYEISILEKRAM